MSEYYFDYLKTLKIALDKLKITDISYNAMLNEIYVYIVNNVDERATNLIEYKHIKNSNEFFKNYKYFGYTKGKT